MPDDAVTPDYLCDNIWIVGDADEVTAKLQAMIDATGGFGSLLLMGHEWQPREPWENTMRLFMEQVLPRLKTPAPLPA